MPGNRKRKKQQKQRNVNLNLKTAGPGRCDRANGNTAAAEECGDGVSVENQWPMHNVVPQGVSWHIDRSTGAGRLER